MLLALFIENFIYSDQRWYIYYKQCKEHIPEPRSEKFKFRSATMDDLPHLRVFKKSHRLQEFKEWFEDGDILLLALRNGQPVAYHCISKQSRTRIPLNRFPLRKDQIWISDIYTLPEYRCQHIATLLREYREWYLNRCGYKEIVSSINEKNIPSLLYARSGSYRMVRYITFRRVLFFKRFHEESDARARFDACVNALTAHS